ncbi:MAG: hypothetical protein KJ574_05355, partial [Nanoarchaeota archaeon]|nr:hypothetical protein [Nanoarchaeota archaeon]
RRRQLAELDSFKMTKESELQKSLDELERMRKIKIDEIKQNEKALDDKEVELLETIKNLELDRDLLDKKEQEIIEKIDQLEADGKLLEEREDELVEESNRLIELEKRIDNKKDIFDKEYAEIENMKNSLKESGKQLETSYQDKTKSLDAQHKLRLKDIEGVQKKLEKSIDSFKLKEDKLKKAKEYKANVSLLLKKQQSLEKALKLLTDKLVKKNAQYKSAATKFETMKSSALFAETGMLELARRQKELEQDKDELAKMQTIIADDEREAESGMFQDFLQHELAKYDKQPVDYSNEIYSLIETARSLLKMRDITKARSVYQQIGGLYEQLSLDAAEKKRIYYAILELKTDIELAHLA